VDIPPVKDPVDVIFGLTGKAVKGAQRLVLADLLESMGGKGLKRPGLVVCVEIPGDHRGQIPRKLFQKIGHKAGAFGLDICRKIKMGGRGKDVLPPFFKPSDNALPGPSGAFKLGGQIRKIRDKMVAVGQAGPVFMVKDHIGLPPGQMGVIAADTPMVL